MGYDYPLQFFNLFIIVEPDEEEWEPHPDSDEYNQDAQQPWVIHCQMLENEIDPDNEIELPNSANSLQTETQILWLGKYYYPFIPAEFYKVTEIQDFVSPI